MRLAFFVVPGEPHGKGRPRFSSRGGFARAYTDKATIAYERAVADAASKSGASIPAGPLRVHVCAFFQRPKRLQRKKDPDETIPHTGKPDADNVLKAVLDGLACIVPDDAVVSFASVSKRYTSKHGDPFVTVEIMEDR